MPSSSAILEQPLTPAAEPDLTPLPTLSVGTWIANFLAIVLPFLAIFATIWLMWGQGFSWLQLGLFLGGYATTAMGITVGFHRMLTHRAFEAVAPVRWLLTVLGSMAVQGPALEWVAVHRRHHQHSDQEDDPHSPHHHNGGFWGVLRGIWHSHVGWLFEPHPPNLSRYVGDYRDDKIVQRINNQFVMWVTIGLLLPAVVAGLLTMSWMGALTGFVWSGLVRVFLVHHVTWSVNSACHLWGSRPYRCGDHSRNNFIFAMLAWGEGWHNNHHAFPTSARHGLRWWEIDVSYLVIRMLAMVGLAWNVRTPSAASIKPKKTNSTAALAGATA